MKNKEKFEEVFGFKPRTAETIFKCPENGCVGCSKYHREPQIKYDCVEEAKAWYNSEYKDRQYTIVNTDIVLDVSTKVFGFKPDDRAIPFICDPDHCKYCIGYEYCKNGKNFWKKNYNEWVKECKELKETVQKRKERKMYG